MDGRMYYIIVGTHTNVSRPSPHGHAVIICSTSTSNRFFFSTVKHNFNDGIWKKEVKKKNLGTHLHKWLIQLLQTPAGGKHVYHLLLL